MTEESNLKNKIQDAAESGIQSTSVDGVSVTRMSIQDQIKAAEFVQKQNLTNIFQAVGVFKVNIK